MSKRPLLAVIGFIVVLTAPIASGADWHDLKVKFRVEGDPPQPAPIRIRKCAFCQGQSLTEEKLIVNKKNGGIRNVVVFLIPAKGVTVPIHKSYLDSAKTGINFKTDKSRFEPHVAVLRTGQSLIVRNVDPVLHNPKFDFYANEPGNPIMPPNTRVVLPTKKEEYLPARVSASIHFGMTAWVVVRDLPYVGVSDANGDLQIEKIPKGNWTFRIWHESAKNLAPYIVHKDVTPTKRGRFDVTIGGGNIDLGTINVPVAAFYTEPTLTK